MKKKVTSNSAYLSNVITLKKMGSHYKAVKHNCLRVSGFETVSTSNPIEISDEENFPVDEEDAMIEKIESTVWDAIDFVSSCIRFESSIIRTKSRIRELGYSNPWEFFVTLTLDPEDVDRYDLASSSKKIRKFINNEARRGVSISYLLIPEQHADGAWHFHGFMSGLFEEDLHLFTLDEKLPYKILNSLKSGKKVYTWTRYAEKFGYTTLMPIENLEAATNYTMKYVTKDLCLSCSEAGLNLYYCSRGLKRAELIAMGTADEIDTADWFEAFYVKIKWLTKEEGESLKKKIIPFDYNANPSGKAFSTEATAAKLRAFERSFSSEVPFVLCMHYDAECFQSLTFWDFFSALPYKSLSLAPRDAYLSLPLRLRNFWLEFGDDVWSCFVFALETLQVLTSTVVYSKENFKLLKRKYIAYVFESIHAQNR